MRYLNEIFKDEHDANIARHYLTVMASEAPPKIARDFTGDFYRVGKDGVSLLPQAESAVLGRLARCQILEAANKPVRFNREVVGYPMALIRD